MLVYFHCLMGSILTHNAVQKPVDSGANGNYLLLHIDLKRPIQQSFSLALSLPQLYTLLKQIFHCSIQSHHA